MHTPCAISPAVTHASRPQSACSSADDSSEPSFQQRTSQTHSGAGQHCPRADRHRRALAPTPTHSQPPTPQTRQRAQQHAAIAPPSHAAGQGSGRGTRARHAPSEHSPFAQYRYRWSCTGTRSTRTGPRTRQHGARGAGRRLRRVCLERRGWVTSTNHAGARRRRRARRRRSPGALACPRRPAGRRSTCSIGPASSWLRAACVLCNCCAAGPAVAQLGPSSPRYPAPCRDTSQPTAVTPAPPRIPRCLAPPPRTRAALPPSGLSPSSRGRD